MASNPMQRKVRNSFLLGIFTMLLIVILIGVIVFFLVIKPKLDKEKQEAAIEYVKVSQLTTNVKSGDEIPAGAVKIVELPKTNVPADAIAGFTGGIAKVNLTAGTVLCQAIVAENETELDSSLRTVEYNVIAIPIGVNLEDTIDIRISFANGQDLVVVSKARVQDIQGDIISLNLTESEILMMNSAIVEAFVVPSARLHITKYTEPGIQEASATTYVPTQEVQNLIASDANITNTARTALTNRFINGLREGYIQQQLDEYSEERKLNLETKVQEQIEKARSARESYLSDMEGV